MNVRQPWCPDDTRRIPLLNYHFGVTSSEVAYKLPRNSVVENVVITLVYCDRFDPRNSVFNHPKKSNVKKWNQKHPSECPKPSGGWLTCPDVLVHAANLGDNLLQETHPKFHAFRPIL